MPDDRQALAHAYWRAVDRLNQPSWRKLFDPGAVRFIQRRLARRASAPVAHQVPLFFGSSMTVVLPEVISEQLHSYGLFDDTVTWMALCAVEPGDTVFDVGAHFGYFSLLFARLAAPDGRVFSFEPTPSTYAVLAGNIGREPRITAVNAAAGAAPGTLQIADYGIKYSAWNTLADEGRLAGARGPGRPARVEVKVDTLDAFAQAQAVTPGFIKIDAENFEPEVLEGAADLLARAQPTLLLEAGSERAAQLASMLAAMGYRAFATDAPGTLEEFPDAPAAAARFKDVLFAAGERAGRLAARALAMAPAAARAAAPVSAR